MTTSRHLPVLQKLLPPVSYDPNGENVKAELSGTAKVLDDLQDSANRVLQAPNPAKVPELLPEWEAAYGLPDSCDGTPATTTEERLGALAAKESSRLPLTLPKLEAIAASVGFPDTEVKKRYPANCTSLCNSLLNGERQRFVMDVFTPYERQVTPATCVSPCTAPLAVYEKPLLECVFHKLEPAHALFKFHYGV